MSKFGTFWWKIWDLLGGLLLGCVLWLVLHDMIMILQKKYDFTTYNFPLLDIIEKNEITKHCDKTEKSQTSHDVNHCVLQIKLS